MSDHQLVFSPTYKWSFINTIHWCCKYTWVCTDKYINRFNFKFYVLCFDYKKTHEFVYLFVWGFSSHLIIFHWFGDVTITGEELQIFYLYSALMAIKQWWFFDVPHLLWHEQTLYCQTFGSGAVTTSFNDLCLSRPGIEPRSPA